MIINHSFKLLIPVHFSKETLTLIVGFDTFKNWTLKLIVYNNISYLSPMKNKHSFVITMSIGKLNF